MDKHPHPQYAREDSSSLRVVIGTEERESVCVCSVGTTMLIFFRQPAQQTERRGLAATSLSTW